MAVLNMELAAKEFSVPAVSQSADVNTPFRTSTERRAWFFSLTPARQI
jgi:hypothetical protein